jgi:NAD(P)-dependent dehydrogenase (short-subunit alcohol dehydrogenase family)
MTNVALILGGGSRVGYAVANGLFAAGYKVAIGRRSPITSGVTAGIKTLHLDVTSTTSIENAFTETTKAYGVPNIVIYNAGNLKQAAPKDDIFATKVDILKEDAQLNIWGPYTALQLATKAWAGLPDDLTVPKVFIMTGNILNTEPVPSLISLGIGKASSAHMVHAATLTEAFQKRNWRFYFASGTTASGGPVYRGLDGPAHAKAYQELIERSEQGDWHVRFVAHDGSDSSQ